MVITDYQDQILKVLKTKLGVRCLEFAHEQCELIGIPFTELTPDNVEPFALSVEKNAVQYVPEHDAMFLASMIRRIWSFMTKRFEWTLSIDLANGLINAMRKKLKERGFEETLRLFNPRAPDIYEFARQDDLISLSVEKGVSNQATLILQSEHEGSEILALICDAIADCIASTAGAVLEPVFAPSRKRAILDRVLDELLGEERPAQGAL